MTASSCVIVSENERRPYARSQISAESPFVRLNRRSAAKLLVAPALLAGPRIVSNANAALRDARVREQISALDHDIRGGTAGEVAAFVSLDISRHKRLAEDMGLAEE